MRSNVKAQSDQTAESDASFRETRRANLFLKDVKNSSERQQGDAPNRGPTDETQVVSVIIKEEAAMYSIDNFGPERRDSIASNTTGFPFENAEMESRLQHYESTDREESGPCLNLGPDVTTAISSVSINEGGVGCTFDIEAHRRLERMNKPAGQGFMKRKSKEEVPEKYAERNITRKYSSGKVKVKMIQKCDKGTSYKRHLWPESKQKVGVESPQCETVLSSKTHSNSHQGAHNVGRLIDPNEYASSLWNAQTVVAPANVIVHQRAQKDLCSKERYFHCTECNKSFIQKVHLIRHQRTHSGERPFHCTECEKSFSQKHHLLGHLRTHSGEKPFQCTKCMKSFSWKEGLYRHQRTHLFQKFSHT
ncbi:zinc finger protein 1 homolog isoform X2 [Ambystoma mexicanum]